MEPENPWLVEEYRLPWDRDVRVYVSSLGSVYFVFAPSHCRLHPAALLGSCPFIEPAPRHDSGRIAVPWWFTSSRSATTGCQVRVREKARSAKM